ncbi:MAG: RimK family alpha-L-glutamate ligase [Rhodospirillales bacterium CG15_BIG_FIL_POST_REV_8_21_14_020_66_15]|nr:MAG: RimK family alpha-L-glutamate ligase [Rhodospirillales bacterium CG15_BIG_FIL_POST_REV_8_21_14_020_66_15]
MARSVIVVDRLSDWQWSQEGLTIQTVDAFIAEKRARNKRPLRVINLCRRYGYLTAGYYCSLLSESRGDLPMPTVVDIIDLAKQGSYAYAVPDLERILQSTMKRLASPPTADFVLHVFFGRPDDVRFRRLAAEVFDAFRYPVLEIHIRREKRWRIRAIRPSGINKVKETLAPVFEAALRAYVRVPRSARKTRPSALYELAVLVDPNEKLPPSDESALRRLVRAGAERRVEVEIVTAKDLQRIPEFDALFIRETTALDHHTFRFSRKAEVEGIPVIDDPRSIMRCTNKVYLAEALKAANVPTPATELLNRATFDDERLAEVEAALGYPVVLKIPDGSFSRGVEKAENRKQFLGFADRLFERSRVILAQEYMYTPFDWRIGLIGGEPLFACQYFMSRAHWQIYRHADSGKTVGGAWETLPVDAAPPAVVETARRAAGLIGDGLYGVDLKETENGVFVIEVNDNPNIDAGVEDKVLKGALYGRVIDEFIRRIDKARSG